MPPIGEKLFGKRAANVLNASELEKRLRLEAARERLRVVDIVSNEHESAAFDQLNGSADSIELGNSSNLDDDDENGELHDNISDVGQANAHTPPLFNASFEEVPQLPPEREDDITYLNNFLAEWACRGVSFIKVDELLAGLNVLFPELTKCHKVLLKSRISFEFESVGQGFLWYKGFRLNLRQRLSEDYLMKYAEMVVYINMDGLDLWDSSKLSFWPILGCLQGQRTPFIVACFCGEGHPSDIDAFLRQFIEEPLDLQTNGYECFRNVYSFRIRHFILDAPARALIKCCIGHTGKCAGEKCTIVGVTKYNRICFVGVDDEGEPRTDESFRNREQPLHLKGTSPLETVLQIKMVSSFRLDAMHLLHGGVMKRWLLYLMGELHRKETAEELHIRKMNRYAGVPQPRFRPRGKISAAAKNSINEAMYAVSPSMPKDFNRCPRPLSYIHLYKCTEFRRFLL
ncbi:ATPase expression protein 1, mitochondrial [Frankliniella fusca]|uniref:ATPase expression protein 1, mitochondrial n=1 Tax=Frankliniella fusca TaxID=407009 RepID=A0AAE1HDQ8_9NEOP|nr:ATPase expression protein 1, mitochondrial [Frankliniella fusca]